MWRGEAEKALSAAACRCAGDLGISCVDITTHLVPPSHYSRTERSPLQRMQRLSAVAVVNVLWEGGGSGE